MRATFGRTASLTALAAAALAACGGSDGDPVVQTKACADLAGMTLPKDRIGLDSNGARIDTATVVAAAGGLPEHCDVRGAILPVDAVNGLPINFRVNLPTSWNDKAVHFGGGGYNGTVVSGTGAVPSAPTGDPVPLARGYATFGSDSGHTGGNASFGTNPEAVLNFGYAQMKKTRDVAVQLMRERYGKAPSRTYWVGSSQGGREGLTVAQRFPADYDGILVRVPVVNFTGLQIFGNRVGQAMYDNGSGLGWMNSAKVQLLHNAVMQVCDPLDGRTDGVISNYAACTFDPTTLRCPSGTDEGNTCLSDKQIATVNAVHQDLNYGFTVANNVNGYSGWGWGHEFDPTASWVTWVTGSAAPTPTTPGSNIANFGAQYVRNFIARDPNYDALSTDPATGFTPARFSSRIQELAPVVDATNPDLSGLRASNGKLIIVEHGGDYARSPRATIAYYNSVVARMGQPAVDEFVRLYFVPGADHGGNGASNWPATQFDWLAALEDWVERNQPPGERIETVQRVGGSVVARRAACKWPLYPRFNGGDPNTAAGYTCAAP
ncbi:tannase/feruloyl esterase family alpha/beta hydrolase [Ramlibacter sp. AW1]|uniref:Tannase/feruloyl esterase family alpha/beta hydrolase n=1 Tax=Ramlibacter aurantiacus TaxID=2801330 RepID=A0A936ZH05_9BURK|nr:tannase/feruloyl esterase family alpha/beta hydrolase [Ramlibacter aurantiacus]MBL0420088.1 tannase/feruloyl esterase family alpha/beta hydrolase [Ramlibacter aurantiacus]